MRYSTKQRALDGRKEVLRTIDDIEYEARLQGTQRIGGLVYQLKGEVARLMDTEFKLGVTEGRRLVRVREERVLKHAAAIKAVRRARQ